ncbi:MAG: hypothetical protein WD342_09725 [Verrucomicrobiales bacterium]
MTPTLHTKAIAIFGIALPSLVIAALLIATLVGRGKIATAHEEKVVALERYRTAKGHTDQLEATMATDNRREKIEYWNSKLDQDFIQSLTRNLDKILAKHDPSVLRQTEMGQATGGGSIAGSTENPHSRIQLSFEGGFKPMQLLLAELETEMPNLILENLEISSMPGGAAGENGKLKFGVVYLCWEKSKS